MIWEHREGTPGVMAPLSYSGDYVISCRPKRFILCYRPPGEHHFVGEYERLDLAQNAAENHASTRNTDCLNHESISD